MNIGIVSDHKGYDLKEQIKNELVNNYNIVDYGCDSQDSVDYPMMAVLLGNAINSKDVDCGISICGTGIGISIAMNKIDNIRCGLVNCVDDAYYTKLHNHANCIAISSKMNLDTAIKTIQMYISTNCDNDDRHLRRISQIKEIENNNEL